MTDVANDPQVPTPTPAPAPADKVAPERLILRSAPRPVTRLNRRTIAFMVGSLAFGMLAGTLWSLQMSPHKKLMPDELFNIDRVSRAETLDRLPSDYSKIAGKLPPATPIVEPVPVPVLGPPLPGDLGAPLLHAQNGGGYDDSMMRLREAEEAAKAGVFFRSNASTRKAGEVQLVAASSDRPFDVLGEPSSSAGVASAPASTTGQTVDRGAPSSARLQSPESPFQVMAGTVIPASLVTGINSDLPGPVVANVSEAVYDTASGRHLLIPQGSRLIGRYDSAVAFGQRRVQVVWNRLILPDTSSMTLDRLPGLDPTGQAGLEDGVDWHTGRLLAGAALSTLLGIGVEVAAPNRTTVDAQGRIVNAARQGAQDSINAIGQEITKRQLDVAPTLTIAPGSPVRVMVNQDLVLRPYATPGASLVFKRGVTGG